MAIKFVRTRDGSDDSIRFQPMERLKVYLFGATVLFASFGMGEAVLSTSLFSPVTKSSLPAREFKSRCTSSRQVLLLTFRWATVLACLVWLLPVF